MSDIKTLIERLEAHAERNDWPPVTRLLREAAWALWRTEAERDEARRDALKEACALDAARTEGRREALEEAAQTVRTCYPKIGHEVLRGSMADAIRALMDKEPGR